MPFHINSARAWRCQMKEFKIEVKNWMMQQSSGDFDFMKHWNNDIPMPLKIMYGYKVAETKGMVKMTLHGDIKERITKVCMCCGRPITNKISQYFGVGPICGDHNYVSPFDTQEELDAAIATYREKLVNTVWTGYIAKSAILSINDDPDIYTKLAEMPTVTDPSTSDKKESTPKQAPQFVINARIGKPNRLTDDYSVFLSFKYNDEAKNAIKSLPARAWDNDNKVWEIEYKDFDHLKSILPNFTFEITGEEIIPTKVEFDNAFQYKTAPMQHQVDGIRYGFEHNRSLLPVLPALSNCTVPSFLSKRPRFTLAPKWLISNVAKVCVGSTAYVAGWACTAPAVRAAAAAMVRKVERMSVSP